MSPLDQYQQHAVTVYVLLARLQPLFDQNNRPQQSGFTAGMQVYTVDAMLALSLRLLSELHYAFSRPLHAAYIDVKAAFDSVDRAALWKALKGAGTLPFLMHLLCDPHTGTTAN